uniref:Uncharacterized protein LOC111128677 n=1 Tax=Crassostrea virginica TaxID=6565 RepID=A0A8B8DPJ9_CRAVI|nr:uncharacterized protein LOC111128677 [Crassostrea virginica]
MGVVDGFKSASIFGKISFILLFIASFCIVIAFTCTGWAESNENFGGGSQIHWGLWRRCTEDEVNTAPCSPLDGWANDWWAFTQAASCFGFFGILVSFFLVILYLFVGSCKGNGEVATGAAILCLLTGVIQLVGCIVFGVEFDDVYYDRGTGASYWEFWLSYAFGLAIVAALLEIVAGVLLILECKKGGGTSASG